MRDLLNYREMMPIIRYMENKQGCLNYLLVLSLIFMAISSLLIIALSFKAYYRGIPMNRVRQHLWIIPQMPTAVPDLAAIIVSPTPQHGFLSSGYPTPVPVTPTAISIQTLLPDPTATTTPTSVSTAEPALLSTHSSTPTTAGTSMPTSIPSPTATRSETRLVIPKLGLDAPVVESPIVGDTWDVSHLRDRVGHLARTASPGGQGNFVLAAHMTLDTTGRAGPFNSLDNLVPGDVVTVYHQGQPFHYHIDQMKTVKPSNVEVSYPSVASKLTLITCLNYDPTVGPYEDRLVAVGHLTQE